jgi:hypothetical protein
MTEENQRTLSRTCPSAISSIINPRGSGLSLILGLRGKRPLTNRQIHGTAKTEGNLVSETLCCVRNTRTCSKKGHAVIITGRWLPVGCDRFTEL